ncbi:MAG: hypothetical protein ABI192_20755 [Bradyrhizobium sp.]
MATDDRKRSTRNDLLLASAMVVAGLAVSGVALGRIAVDHRQEMAQATQPLQGTPAPVDDKAPAESKPGGMRPTTPAPEPARPDAEAQQQGAKPALPPAPAEKTAAPISERK